MKTPRKMYKFAVYLHLFSYTSIHGQYAKYNILMIFAITELKLICLTN